MLEHSSNRQFIPIKIALLAISDTRSLDDDKSGDVLEARIKKAGHMLVNRDVLQDDRPTNASKLRCWTQNSDIDVIISTGGSGLTGRDVTVEAHRDV